jgi:hypothetical protein
LCHCIGPTLKSSARMDATGYRYRFESQKTWRRKKTYLKAKANFPGVKSKNL